MIKEDSLITYIQNAIPDARVTVVDRTGTMDHFIVQVISDVFKNQNLLDRHRLVYQALSEPMGDGRIHAVEIKTQTHQGN